ncbi:MAG: hypothetical protein WDM85_05905 [Caulobacteraceae bacterium]
MTAVSALIPNYLGRQVLSASYVETYRGNGQHQLLLRNFPITAVASVAFAGQNGHGAGGSGGPDQRLPVRRSRPDPDRQRFPVGLRSWSAIRPGTRRRRPTSRRRRPNWWARAFRRRDRIGLSSKSLGGQEVVAFSLKDMNDHRQGACWRLPGCWRRSDA